MYQWVVNEVKHSPEILLFLCLSFGYLIGYMRFGKFQLGGVAGSLIMGVFFSLFGIEIDNGVKAVLFALFIYAVGFESGPQFFRSLGPKSAKEILLALFVAVVSFFTVIIMARLFSLDKGLAAGLAAGGLTQSAIIGTAGDALSHLNLGPVELKKLQDNIAIGYAVTYVFGSLGAIIICVNILPKFMGKNIRDDAICAEKQRLRGAIPLNPNQELALEDVVSRVYRYSKCNATQVQTFEKNKNWITVERIKRNRQFIHVTPSTRIKHNDILLIVGRREDIVAAGDAIGTEIGCAAGMEVVMNTLNIVLRTKKYLNKPISRINTDKIRHGVYILAIYRNNEKLKLTSDLKLKSGDIVILYGADNDVKRVAHDIGDTIPITEKTDWVYHGFGIAFGLIIGLVVLHIGSVPLTLGAGGGALLSGLLFGWFRNSHQLIGNMPTAASQILKDLGLAGFVAVIGLQSGYEAINTIIENGLTLFLIGIVVTILPLLLALVFGCYILRYDNSAIFAGALSGSRSANPAFGGVIDKAGNSIPTTPFAITYALANVFLTLLGPLVVAFG